MENDQDTGYGKPPKSTRFRKGQSGNPRGRPTGKTWHHEAPFEAVLGEKVTIRENGMEREVTAAQAFLLHLQNRELKGVEASNGFALELHEFAKRGVYAGNIFINVIFQLAGSVIPALLALRMGRLFNALRPTAKFKLEPWFVEDSLAKGQDRRFTPEEQNVIVDATRTPHKVNWPAYWSAMPDANECKK